jgi:hypothetical protein
MWLDFSVAFGLVFRMHVAAKAGFIAWCVWFVVQLFLAISSASLRGPSGEPLAYSLAGNFGSIPLIAGGCVLTGFLAKRPRRGLAITLFVLSLLLLWKFLFGEIVFGMHQKLGGYTFTQSLSLCWSNHTSGVVRFLLWFTPIVLLVASMVFYPLYSLMSHKNGL